MYDLDRKQPPRKIQYGRLAFTASAAGDGRVYFAAGFQGGQPLEGIKPRFPIIVLEPLSGDSLPEYEIIEAFHKQREVPVQGLAIRGNALVARQPAGEIALDLTDLERRVPVPPKPEKAAAPADVQAALPWEATESAKVVQAAGGPWVLVWNREAGMPWGGRSGIYLIRNRGEKEFFPVPMPDLALWEKLRKGAPSGPRLIPGPAELTNEIGPFALDGDTVWFANTFDDGEGMSGVGAVGSFDLVAREYRMRYLPTIAPWSASALLLDGDDLWIGLMRRPEGSPYGGGLLRYNRRTRALRQYPVRDLINTMERLGRDLYLGTSHGVYRLCADKLTQLRFEPDANGQLVMAARSVEQ